MSEHNLPVPDDVPWIDLTPEEVQELRTKKQELTEYGKQKIRELMNDGKLIFHTNGKEVFRVEDPYWGGCKSPETQLYIKEMTHEEMLEEAARREKENKVLDIATKFMEENSEAMEKLAAIERKDLIDYALEELNAIVMGGQDTREFYNSVSYIRKVLESLK